MSSSMIPLIITVFDLMVEKKADIVILRLRELQVQADMDGTAKSEHKKRIKTLQRFIERQKTKVLEFDEALVRKLLEKVTAHNDYLEFRFKSGVTVSVEK